MLMILSVLMLVAVATAEPKFETIQLSTADTHLLVIPAGLNSSDGQIDLFVQLKGSPRGVAAQLDAAGLSAAMIVVTDQGLSRAYAQPFSDPQLLDRMMSEALTRLRERLDNPRVSWGRLSIGSFSAGYAAVRELLKHDRWVDRIDALYFQDSIYAGYVSENDRSIVPEQMAGFIRFAKLAVEGEKTMVLTHCRLTPGTYASTWETADLILEALGLQATTLDPPEVLADGFAVYRRAERGRFLLIGTPGEDGPEHVRHLTHMRLFLDRLPIKRHIAD